MSYGLGGVSPFSDLLPDTIPVLTDKPVKFFQFHAVTPSAPLLAQTFLYASFMFFLSSICSSNSDILCVLRSFPLPASNPMFMRLRLIYVSPTSACQIFAGTYIRLHGYIVLPFGSCAVHLLWLLLTSHSSLLLRLLMVPSVRPHGINPCSFLVYPSNLRLWVTATFRASLSCANSPSINALLSDFCP